MPPAEDANELIRLLFERNKVAMNDRPATLNADNAKSVNQTAPTAANTQGIKDYLNLGQKANSNSVTLMPLSQRAATEVTNTDQVGQFTVRQVSSQDYQKEWVASNKAVEDPAIALAYPAYGFIDYQRQLIVVLQSPLENPSAQSKQSVVPKS